MLVDPNTLLCKFAPEDEARNKHKHSNEQDQKAATQRVSLDRKFYCQIPITRKQRYPILDQG